jgi:hypothetical protein
MARGDDARQRTLPDCICYQHNYFKPHGEHAIVSACVSRNGKKNSDGHAEFLGFLRHMHPEQCAQGAQALYLVERFDSGLEKMPSFESKESWYSIPYSVTGRAVEEGGNSKGRVLPQELSYNTQRKHFKAAFKVCGIRSMKVTHAGRVGQAQRALQAMVSREDIFAAGRWLYNPCDKAYLTGLTPSFLLFTAGLVEPAKRNKLKYALPRATVPPPTELLELVFPTVPAKLLEVKKVRTTIHFA